MGREIHLSRSFRMGGIHQIDDPFGQKMIGNITAKNILAEIQGKHAGILSDALEGGVVKQDAE